MGRAEARACISLRDLENGPLRELPGNSWTLIKYMYLLLLSTTQKRIGDVKSLQFQDEETTMVTTP